MNEEKQKEALINANFANIREVCCIKCKHYSYGDKQWHCLATGAYLMRNEYPPYRYTCDWFSPDDEEKQAHAGEE